MQPRSVALLQQTQIAKKRGVKREHIAVVACDLRHGKRAAVAKNKSACFLPM